MSTEDILNRLLAIEASAALVVENCQELKKKLQPVSTGCNQKTELISPDIIAHVLGRKKRNIIRNKKLKS